MYSTLYHVPPFSLSEAMSAPFARELGRLVYKYGGVPVASFLPSPSNPVLKSTTTNALFMDATHDNDPGHILVSHTHYITPVHSKLSNSFLPFLSQQSSCISDICFRFSSLAVCTTPYPTQH